jgi:8-oxo-dGTP pyrophosphatase MutT (NUDIX family)
MAQDAPIVLDPALRARIVGHFSWFTRHTCELGAQRAAAEALALVPGEQGEAAFLLTRRAIGLPHHRGQFALPGGRLDAGETPTMAARRELFEELGVALGEDAVLGLLDDFVTRSGFLITPVVLWGPEVRELVPNEREVALAYRVPLADLYRPDVPSLHREPGVDGEILSLPLVGTRVYSPTAAIVYQLREVALEGRPTRVHHYDQPRFAWK